MRGNNAHGLVFFYLVRWILILRKGESALKHYFMEKDEVLRATGSTANGLTSSEAEQRLVKHGPNKLEESKKPLFQSEFSLRFPIQWFSY